MSSRGTWLCSAALVASLLLAPGLAAAQGEVEAAEWTIQSLDLHERPMRIDLMANLGIFENFHLGLSAWFHLPILHDGFLPEINDEFALEAGAYFQWHLWYGPCNFSWFRVTPLVGVKWLFYLLPEWSVYATVKIGASIGFGASNSCPLRTTLPWLHRFDGLAAVGTYYQLTDSIDLRAELGNYGFHFGVSFRLGSLTDSGAEASSGE